MPVGQAVKLDSSTEHDTLALQALTRGLRRWDLALAELSKNPGSGLEPHSFKVKVDVRLMDPLVNYSLHNLVAG